MAKVQKGSTKGACRTSGSATCPRQIGFAVGHTFWRPIAVAGLVLAAGPALGQPQPSVVAGAQNSADAAFVGHVNPCTHHVAAAGDDGNTGTAPGQPAVSVVPLVGRSEGGVLATFRF